MFHHEDKRNLDRHGRKREQNNRTKTHSKWMRSFPWEDPKAVHWLKLDDYRPYYFSEGPPDDGA